MFSYGVRLVSMAVSVITLIGAPVALDEPPAAVVAAAPAAVVAAAAFAVVAADPLLLSLPHAAKTSAAAANTKTKPRLRRNFGRSVMFSLLPLLIRDTPRRGQARAQASR